jgi:hypothetical protein
MIRLYLLTAVAIVALAAIVALGAALGGCASSASDIGYWPK